MFGDRLDTDMAFAESNSLDSVLLFSGVTRPDHPPSVVTPTYSAPSLGALFDLSLS